MNDDDDYDGSEEWEPWEPTDKDPTEEDAMIVYDDIGDEPPEPDDYETPAQYG